MSKTRSITFSGLSGYFKVTSAEYGPGSIGSILDRVVFTSVSGTASLSINLGFTAVQVAAGAVVTAGAAVRTATLTATTMIVPGSVILTDDQASPTTWTDNGDGTLTPANGDVLGVSGTINYISGAVSLTYASDPGITNVNNNDYSRYIYATLASTAVSVNPAIIVNEKFPLYGSGEVLVFTASAGTPYASVRYTPTSSM